MIKPWMVVALCVSSSGCASLSSFPTLTKFLPGAKPKATDTQGSDFYSQGLAARRAKWLEDDEKRQAQEERSANDRLLADRSGNSTNANASVALGAPRPLADREFSNPRSIGATEWEGSAGQAPAVDRVERTSQASRLGHRDKPAKPKADISDHEAIARVLDRAHAKLESMESYRAVMLGMERIDGKLSAPEEILLSVHREPKRIRLEWKTGAHQGREVLYADDGADRLMHVKMSDLSLLKPTLALEPTSPLALKNSRHPITEAGLDTIVRNLDRALEEQDQPNPKLGKVTYEGVETPEGYVGLCYKVVRVTPAGETWVVDFDKTTGLPAVTYATSSAGELLERYTFSNVQPNPSDLTLATAFDPQARWGSSTSGAAALLQRFAKATSTQTSAPETISR